MHRWSLCIYVLLENGRQRLRSIAILFYNYRAMTAIAFPLHKMICEWTLCVIEFNKK